MPVISLQEQNVPLGDAASPQHPRPLPGCENHQRKAEETVK